MLIVILFVVPVVHCVEKGVSATAPIGGHGTVNASGLDAVSHGCF